MTASCSVMGGGGSAGPDSLELVSRFRSATLHVVSCAAVSSVNSSSEKGWKSLRGLNSANKGESQAETTQHAYVREFNAWLADKKAK